jgi:hypothetical protein
MKIRYYIKNYKNTTWTKEETEQMYLDAIAECNHNADICDKYGKPWDREAIPVIAEGKVEKGKELFKRLNTSMCCLVCKDEEYELEVKLIESLPNFERWLTTVEEI